MDFSVFEGIQNRLKYSQRLLRYLLHCWQQWQILPINEYKNQTKRNDQRPWIPLKCKTSQLTACHLQGLHKCICWLHVFVVTGQGFPWVRRDYETSSWQLEENIINKTLGQCSGPPSSDPISSCLLFIWGFAAILCQLLEKKQKTSLWSPCHGVTPSWSILHPRASMSLLISVIMRSHSSPSEASWPSSEAALPSPAPLPLVVESEAELAVRR